MSWVYDIGVAKYYAFMDTNQQQNAIEFYNYFTARGVTLEAICGMLGNICRESTLNPGIKQSSSTSSGWGLIQWTPSTVLTYWCTHGRRLNWYDGYAQCFRIWCEGTGEEEAGGYWLPTTQYPYTWHEFCNLDDVEEATKAYLFERERAGVSALDQRIFYAKGWYEWFTGHPVPPTPPTPPTPFKIQRKFPIWMWCRTKKRRIS